MPVPTVTHKAGTQTPRRRAFLPINAHICPRGSGTAASSTSPMPLTSFQAAAEDVRERVQGGMLKNEWWRNVWVAEDNLAATFRGFSPGGI